MRFTRAMLITITAAAADIILRYRLRYHAIALIAI